MEDPITNTGIYSTVSQKRIFPFTKTNRRPLFLGALPGSGDQKSSSADIFKSFLMVRKSGGILVPALFRDRFFGKSMDFCAFRFSFSVSPL